MSPVTTKAGGRWDGVVWEWKLFGGRRRGSFRMKSFIRRRHSMRLWDYIAIDRTGVGGRSLRQGSEGQGEGRRGGSPFISFPQGVWDSLGIR